MTAHQGSHLKFPKITQTTSCPCSNRHTLYNFSIASLNLSWGLPYSFWSSQWSTCSYIILWRQSKTHQSQQAFFFALLVGKIQRHKVLRSNNLHVHWILCSVQCLFRRQSSSLLSDHQACILSLAFGFGCWSWRSSFHIWWLVNNWCMWILGKSQRSGMCVVAMLAADDGITFCESPVTTEVNVRRSVHLWLQCWPDIASRDASAKLAPCSAVLHSRICTCNHLPLNNQ